MNVVWFLERRNEPRALSTLCQDSSKECGGSLAYFLGLKREQKGGKMTVQNSAQGIVQNPEKSALNKRFESVAWGLFFIMLGGFMLIPETTVSKGIWSIGLGLILLGLNAARCYNGIRMSGFTTFLGILSLVGGIVQLLGWKSMDGAFFLIVLGAYLILKPWFEERKLFGKAEQS